MFQVVFSLAPPWPVGLLDRPIDTATDLPHEVQTGQRRVRNGQRVGRDHSPHRPAAHTHCTNHCTAHDRRGHWRYGGWPPVPRQKHFRERFRLGATPMQRCSASGLLQWVLRHEYCPVHTAVRNCMRDEGGPFEVGNQVLTSSHRKLLSSKAMVVNVAETPGQDSGRQG